MRIGVNCHLLQHNIGGMKQYFLTLFDELLNHDSENKYVLFWWLINECELHKLSSDRWRESSILVHDEKEILKYLDRFDVFFAPFGAMCPRPIPRPSVVMLPDVQEQFYPDFFSDEDLYVRELHFLSSTRMADRVVTLSEFSRNTLTRYHRISKEKVVVAYPSPDPRFHLGERYATWSGRPLPPDFIFFPAHLWPHKNHEGLLMALRILRRERGLVINALFTGLRVPGGYPLESKAVKYGVADQIHWLGFLPQEEIIYLFRKAKVLVFPSLFEGFGIPLVEAMATGCPVAASCTTSVPEVVGEAALLFDPTSPRSIAQAIERIWFDNRLRENLRTKGSERIKKFSTYMMAESHRRAFLEAQQSFSRRRFWLNRFVYDQWYRFWAENRKRQRAAVQMLLQLCGAVGLREEKSRPFL
jgi:glycosyltransferase involved in cell wall biosynthesis